MAPFDTEDKNLQRSVGVPTRELVLHHALQTSHRQLINPGRGRKLVYLHEPILSSGRPDGLLIIVNPSAYASFKAKQLRLPSFTSAEALAEAGDSSSNRSRNRTIATLNKNGWTRELLTRSANVIHYTLAVEAKMDNWKQAIRQAGKYRFDATASAILMPKSTVSRVRHKLLDNYHIGLIGFEQDRLNWIKRSPAGQLTEAVAAWTVELLLRNDHQLTD